MLNRSREMKLLAAGLIASAGMLVSGAAFAAPYESQGERPQLPSTYQQAPPAYVEYEHTYTRTQRLAPVVDSTRVYDRDLETATTMPPEQPALPVTNPDGIRYMSGGIGADEQARFDSAQAEYPVKLVFANSHGAYVSDVNVTVMEESGRTILGLQTDGPILLLDLEPGSYTIEANDNNQIKTQNITVSSNAPKSYTMHFKASDPQDYSMTAE